MIGRAQKLGYKVKVYAPGNPNALLKYGQYYYSFVNAETKNNEKEIIFHFPETPVNVKKLKVKTSVDVFPNSWEIQISKDNETYETLKQSNEPFCKKEYQTNATTSNKVICSIQDVNAFEISNKKDQYANFVKFVLISNTHYDESMFYSCLMTFYGFELIGDLYVKYKHCSHRRKCFINKNLMFVLLILNSL